MDCEKFIYLSENWKGKTCLFGIGECGSKWGYEIIKEAGFKVSFYVDNYRHGEVCNGLPVYDIEYLRSCGEDVLCIVTVAGENGSEIIRQLADLHIDNVIWLHNGEDIRIELPQFLDERGDQILMCKFPSLMDDKIYLTRRYKTRTGRDINWDNPQTFNEKLQWLKVYNRDPIYTTMVDKAAVKEFVAEKIGRKYIIPTIDVYDCFDDIDLEELPNRFVLKCTHDSGSVVICKDKNVFDIESARNKLENARKKNYFWPDREWPYYGVPRRIIAEEFIESKSDMLEVYKIFNFMGTPEIIQVIQDDKTSRETIDYFDTSWNLLELRQNFPNSKKHLPKPKQLQTILELSKALSQDSPFIRTDFYITDNEILFSEFTFYTDSGCELFHPDDWDEKLGRLIVLPDIALRN